MISRFNIQKAVNGCGEDCDRLGIKFKTSAITRGTMDSFLVARTKHFPWFSRLAQAQYIAGRVPS